MSAEPQDYGSPETVRLGDLSIATNLSDGWNRWRGFVQLLPGESSKIPRLFLVTDNPDDLPRYRQQHLHTGLVEPIGCHFLQDVAVSGHLYLFNEGRLITDGSHLSHVARMWLSEYPAHAAGADPHRHLVTIDEPIIPVGGPGHGVYGHWIIAVDLFCKRVCLPTFAHSNGLLFHSFIRSFYTRQTNHQNFSYVRYGGRQYLSPESSKRGRRLYIARTVKEGDLRVFLQREYFERKAEELGFELVRPEQYPHQEQINMFSAASMIIGEYGSGLHNSVFCPPDAIVAVANLLGVEQGRLCAAFDQVNIYLPCEEKWRDDETTRCRRS